MGDRKNFTQNLCELASDKDEIVAVVPLKAEGAPVPGVGFSPEAVPGNSAETKNTQNHQPLVKEFGDETLTLNKRNTKLKGEAHAISSKAVEVQQPWRDSDGRSSMAYSRQKHFGR
jgi:hypothetical protein